jgi:hypothetical protein
MLHDRSGAPDRSNRMDEDTFNISVRKFLKEVGVTSQREIEKAVRDAVQNGRLPEDGEIEATMTLELRALGVTHVVERVIELG